MIHGVTLAMAGLAMFATTTVLAQTSKSDATTGTALGRRIESNTAIGTSPARQQSDGRASARLQTRIENRLQTRIERFTPLRADAGYAYRAPTDDGSRRSAILSEQPILPPPEPTPEPTANTVLPQ